MNLLIDFTPWCNFPMKLCFPVRVTPEIVEPTVIDSYHCRRTINSGSLPFQPTMTWALSQMEHLGSDQPLCWDSFQTQLSCWSAVFQADTRARSFRSYSGPRSCDQDSLDNWFGRLLFGFIEVHFHLSSFHRNWNAGSTTQSKESNLAKLCEISNLGSSLTPPRHSSWKS